MDEQTIEMINPADDDDDDDEDYDDDNQRSGLEMIGREKETEKDRGLRRRTEGFRRTGGPGQEEQEQKEKEQEQERVRDVARPDLSPQAKRFLVILPRNKSSILFKRSMFQHIYWCLFHFCRHSRKRFRFIFAWCFFLLGGGGCCLCFVVEPSCCLPWLCSSFFTRMSAPPLKGSGASKA